MLGLGWAAGILADLGAEGNSEVARHLALVAVGALLGAEIFRGHAKHVIALDADAMKNAFGPARGRGDARLRFG
jgi:hypothetical protein